MANWLVTVNYDDFELDKAFDALPEIYWKNSTTNQDKGLQVNDIVYVYATKPVSKVMYLKRKFYFYILLFLGGTTLIDQNIHSHKKHFGKILANSIALRDMLSLKN